MKNWIAVAVMAFGAAAYAQGTDAGSMSGKSSAKGADAGTAMHGREGGEAGAQQEGAMNGFMPSKVTHEDNKGINEMWKSYQEAFTKKDVNAAAGMIDFPVLMVTDDGKGNVKSASWDHDTWVSNMQKMVQNMPMPKGGKMPVPQHHNEFLTNDIAVTSATTRMPMGKTQVSVKSSALLVHKDGKWMIKSMAEGGWGNTMSESK